MDNELEKKIQRRYQRRFLIRVGLFILGLAFQLQYIVPGLETEDQANMVYDFSLHKSMPIIETVSYAKGIFFIYLIGGIILLVSGKPDYNSISQKILSYVVVVTMFVLSIMTIYKIAPLIGVIGIIVSIIYYFLIIRPEFSITEQPVNSITVLSEEFGIKMTDDEKYEELIEIFKKPTSRGNASQLNYLANEFEKLSGYKESDSYREKCRKIIKENDEIYNRAMQLYNRGVHNVDPDGSSRKEALELFEKIKGWRETDEYIEKANQEKERVEQ